MGFRFSKDPVPVPPSLASSLGVSDHENNSESKGKMDSEAVGETKPILVENTESSASAGSPRHSSVLTVPKSSAESPSKTVLVQRRGSIKVNLTQEEHKEASELFTHKNPSVLACASLLLELEPHTHTLFCERKERVCMSHGKLQEHEKVTVKLDSSSSSSKEGNEQQQQQQYSNHCWFRSEKPPSTVASSSSSSSSSPHATEGWLQGAQFFPIPGTLGSMHYELAGRDVDCFVKFAPSSAQTEGTGESATVLGPVLPGPPRLQAFTISSSSSDGALTPGQYLVANTDYIGGYEGASEYWWMRIRQGERETLGEPVPLSAAQVALGVPELLSKASVALGGVVATADVPVEVPAAAVMPTATAAATAATTATASDGNSNAAAKAEAIAFLETDPRVRLLTRADIGCVFKVKCRPVRGDGHKGEIFTSKPCKEVQQK